MGVRAFRVFFIAMVHLVMAWASYGSIWAAPIDVVIPSCAKDVEVLDWCIQSIRAYGKDVRRVIVVSNERLTDNAEWFDESLYPFGLQDLGEALFPDDPERAFWFATECPRRGWVYQQLLKLYAPFVIPDLSSNVLVLDSDVVFMQPVCFLSENGLGLYNIGTEYHTPYFEHMDRLLPGLHRVFPSCSGICHHILLQHGILSGLFETIEAYHKKPLWKAVCECIDLEQLERSSFSEYEIYFNYVFSQPNQGTIRLLRWGNGGYFSPEIVHLHRLQGMDYVAYHAYSRGVSP